jgi:hypothetical protein
MPLSIHSLRTFSSLLISALICAISPGKSIDGPKVCIICSDLAWDARLTCVCGNRVGFIGCAKKIVYPSGVAVCVTNAAGLQNFPLAFPQHQSVRSVPEDHREAPLVARCCLRSIRLRPVPASWFVRPRALHTPDTVHAIHPLLCEIGLLHSHRSSVPITHLIFPTVFPSQ